MRKLIIKCLLFVPLGILVAATNFMADPAQLFKGGKYELSVAGTLLEGRNAAGVRDCDERLLQKFLIQGFQDRHEVVVFGSSRSMVINRYFFPGKSFFNHSVSGASLEDDIALYGLLRGKGHIPSVAVLCLDPWLFNRHNGQTRWQSLRQEYLSMRQLLTGREAGLALNPAILKKKLELVSLSYFRTSIRGILADFLGKQKMSGWYATHDMYEKNMVRLSDGSITYDEESRVAGEPGIMRKVQAFLRIKPAYALGRFTRIEPDLAGLFESYVRLLKEDGVNVVFFLPPYHPVVFDFMIGSEEYRIIGQVEQYAKAIAARENISLHGSYDPEKYGLKNSDFYDAIHARYSVLAGIFSKDSARGMVWTVKTGSHGICSVSKEEIKNDGRIPVSASFNGKTYNFCCQGCKEQFEKAPDKFIKDMESRQLGGKIIP